MGSRVGSMLDQEPVKRGSPNPFGAFLEGINSRDTEALPTPVGSALALEVQRVLVEGATSTRQMEAIKSIDGSSVGALMRLGGNAEEYRIDELGERLKLTGRQTRMAVYPLAENGLIEITNENHPNEAVRLTAAGRAMLDRVSEIVASR
jgi:hypothetical protein